MPLDKNKKYNKVFLRIFLQIMLFCPSLVAMLAFPNANASDPALDAGFIPHKALYDISLKSKKSGTIISNLSGKMVYEWRSGCDGWMSDYKVDMLYEYVATPAVRMKSDLSTYESFDGKSFNFNVQRKKNSKLYEAFRGATHVDLQGSPEKVVYNMPEGLVQNLPKGALFPMGQTLDVFNKAQKGIHYYEAVLFDGSDGEGPVEVNTFIGKEYIYEQKEDGSQKDIEPSLLNTKAWNIRMAFFPPAYSNATMPEYEMSVVFHENGVISNMEIEYKDFSLSQNLRAVELIKSACNKEKPGD